MKALISFERERDGCTHTFQACWSLSAKLTKTGCGELWVGTALCQEEGLAVGQSHVHNLVMYRYAYSSITFSSGQKWLWHTQGMHRRGSTPRPRSPTPSPQTLPWCKQSDCHVLIGGDCKACSQSWAIGCLMGLRPTAHSRAICPLKICTRIWIYLTSQLVLS